MVGVGGGAVDAADVALGRVGAAMVVPGRVVAASPPLVLQAPSGSAQQTTTSAVRTPARYGSDTVT